MSPFRELDERVIFPFAEIPRQFLVVLACQQQVFDLGIAPRELVVRSDVVGGQVLLAQVADLIPHSADAQLPKPARGLRRQY